MPKVTWVLGTRTQNSGPGFFRTGFPVGRVSAGGKGRSGIVACCGEQGGGTWRKQHLVEQAGGQLHPGGQDANIFETAQGKVNRFRSRDTTLP